MGGAGHHETVLQWVSTKDSAQLVPLAGSGGSQNQEHSWHTCQRLKQEATGFGLLKLRCGSLSAPTGLDLGSTSGGVIPASLLWDQRVNLDSAGLGCHHLSAPGTPSHTAFPNMPW